MTNSSTSADSAAPLLELARQAESSGDPERAIECYRRALRRDASHVAANVNLGALLGSLGRFEEALPVCRRAAELAPWFAPAWVNLGSVLGDLRLFDDAALCYERALVLVPEDPVLCADLAGALLLAGRVDDAIERARAGLRRNPAAVELHSLMLFALNFASTRRDELRLAHESINATLSAGPTGIPRLVTAHIPRASRLRLGIVSPDLHSHSVSYFLAPILDRFDRRRLHLSCFSTGRISDAVTDRIRARADSWLACAELTDDALAARIRQAGIDVLIDLSGHTTGSRPGLFALRPAGCQVAFLGYPTDSGVREMQYRISDPEVDPIAEAATASVLRLPHSYFCYRPPPNAPAVSPPPMLQAGYPTFGSFNALPKITAATLRTWAELLHLVPNARLLLKAQGLAQLTTRTRLLDRCEAAGIQRSRVDLLDWQQGLPVHLDCYRRVDVAIDSFPYNGATTTCEALWMGVPVVSLRGETHASRMGCSILGAAGHREWAASDDASFVRICSDLVAEPRRLAQQRLSQRASIAVSALMNEVEYVAAWEQLILRAAEGHS